MNTTDNKTLVRAYKEIKAGLNRMKNAQIDAVLNEPDINLTQIVDATIDIVNDYEQMRLLFKSWIFENKIPESCQLKVVNADDDEYYDPDENDIDE